MEPADLSDLIKKAACRAGIDLCRIAKPRPLTQNGTVLRKWCSDGMNSQMSYLARDPHVRENPLLLFPDTKSVVVAAVNYYNEQPGKSSKIPSIARYALGTDYHSVIRSKLELVLNAICEIVPQATGKICVDSSPVLEKAWAVEAGIGWQGKHSLVITKEYGSWILIGLLLLNIDAKADEAEPSGHCGECTLCIDCCPPGAINLDKTIDARKCISNHTIENRGEIPPEIVKVLNNRVYGCDICQEVCPYNRHSVINSHPEFIPSRRMGEMSLEDWTSMSEDDFIRIFKNTPVERVKYNRFKRNISLAVNRGE